MTGLSDLPATSCPTPTRRWRAAEAPATSRSVPILRRRLWRHALLQAYPICIELERQKTERQSSWIEEHFYHRRLGAAAFNAAGEDNAKMGASLAKSFCHLPAMRAHGTSTPRPSGNDPVESGLVDSLNRPGGNVTGVNTQGYLLLPKRLQILRELIPNAQTIAMLVPPDFPISTAKSADAAAATAPILKIKVDFWRARTDSELDDAFATSRADALLVNPSPFFVSHNKRIVELAQRHSMPVMYPFPENVAEGGLIAYSPSRFDVGHQKGIYTGRILKGERPADLPVMQPARIELMINLKTAKALGLTIPEMLLATADEVIQ